MAPRLPSLLRPPIGFAHRGARSHAEANTLEAFRLAVRLGATGLWGDVWITGDGVAVLHSDGSVGGRLRRRPIAEVSRADLPPSVPSLAGLYEACGPDVPLALEVRDPAAAPEVIATARDVGGESSLWLCHPDLDTLASWRALAPAARLVHLSRFTRLGGSHEAHAAAMSRLGVDAVQLPHSDWTGGTVALYHRFERLTIGADATFERVIDELLDSGIDAVVSDRSDLLATCLDRLAR